LNKEGKPNVPYRDPNKAPYFGKSIKEQYKILCGETPLGGLAPGQGSSVQSANAAAIAAAAENKAVEEWLSDRDGYGVIPNAARGAYANMSSMQMLLTEAERRFYSADWQTNLSEVSSRALWVEYLRMRAISNYLREVRMRQNESKPSGAPIWRSRQKTTACKRKLGPLRNKPLQMTCAAK
jgi:hypothetical protein